MNQQFCLVITSDIVQLMPKMFLEALEFTYHHLLRVVKFSKGGLCVATMVETQPGKTGCLWYVLYRILT